MRRGVLVALVMLLLLIEPAQAQSTIPDGVFVRESNGTTWLVLKGQRVGVPVWQASDADIQAIPSSDQWAVLSVNDAGAIVGGSKPAWLSTQQAPPVATTTAPAPPADPTAVRVEVAQTITFRNSSGGVQVQGFIQNTGQVPAGSIDMATSLLDANGATVGAGGGDPALHVLAPGAKVPFSTSAGDATDFKDVRVQVQAKAPSTYERYTYQWRVDGASVTPASRTSTWAKLTGQLVNTGPTSANLIRITMAIYDASGALLEVRSGSPKLDEIGPGQSSPFEITLIGGRQLKDIPNYELWVEGRPK